MFNRVEKLRENFEGLCVAHYTSVLRYLVAISGDRHKAEDLAQETFLAAYRGLDRFEEGRDFLPYVRGIARNLYLKSLRDAPKAALSLIENIDSLFHAEERAGVDGVAALEKCLQRLEKEEKDLLDAHYKQGVPLDDIAALMGQSLSSAKVRMHRIRKKLRQCLSPKLVPGGAS